MRACSPSKSKTQVRWAMCPQHGQALYAWSQTRGAAQDTQVSANNAVSQLIRQ